MRILQNLGLSDQATQLEQQYGLPAGLLSAQADKEGGVDQFGNAITNSSGHVGLAQVSLSTAADPGPGVAPLTDPTNNSASLNFMAAYDAYRTKIAGGDLDAGLSGYSGGAYTASSLLGGAQGMMASGTPITGGSLSDIGTSLATGLNYITGAGNGGTPGNMAAAATAAQSSGGATLSLSQFFSEYFVRAVVIILGLIFVAVGLTYFRGPVGNAAKTVVGHAKRIARGPAGVTKDVAKKATETAQDAVPA